MSKIGETLTKWLRWSERYTKTDMLYAAKGGFWLTLGQAIASGCAFVLSIVFANAISKETYGTYKYILSMAGLLGIFTLPQMGTAVIQSVARGYEGSIVQAMKSTIRWGVLATIACLGLAIWQFNQGDTAQAGAFLLLSVCLPVLNVFSFYRPLLVGRKLFRDSVNYSVITRIVSTILLIGTALLTKNLLLIVVAYFVPNIIMNGLIFRIVMRRFKPNNRQDEGVVSYGKHLSLVSVISTVANYLDRLLVFHLLGAGSLAVYSIATAPPEQIKSFVGVLENIGLPRFAQRSAKEIHKNMRSKYLNMFLLSGTIIVAYVIAAPFLYHLIFPKYPESVRYSQLFVLGLLNFILWPAGLFLRAKRHIKEIYLSNTIASILQIVLMVGLTFWMGLLGLVLARVITRLVGGVIDLILYHRVLPHGDEPDALPQAQD